MSAEHVARAQQQLEDLIVELGGLRNAGTRDPGFKAWRQNTLTVIQLLWPSDLSRSDRFRRVPFSPPSNRMNNKLTREFFERGCAEAVVLLRSFITEISEHGLPEPGSGPVSRTSDTLAEDDFPLVELPREGEAPESSEPAPLSDEIDLGGNLVSLPPSPSRPAPPPAPGPRASLGSSAGTRARNHTSKEPNGSKSDRRKGSRIGPWARKSGAKPRLKDMLGFTDEASSDLTPATPPARPAPPRPSAPRRAAPPLPDSGKFVVRGAPARPADPPPVAPSPEAPSPVASPAPVTQAPTVPPAFSALPTPPDTAPLPASMPPLPGAPPPIASAPSPPSASREESISFEHEFAPPLAPQSMDLEPQSMELEPESMDFEPESMDFSPIGAEAAPSREDQVLRDAADEFLRTSPVLSAEAHPVKRGERRTAQPSSPTAAALTAIAAEIANLGVPEGQRAGARAALLDLARQLDDHTLSWESLRESVQFVMEFPNLARRVLPLLIAYLDLAA